MNQPSGKIIEIGWCVANPFTKEVFIRDFKFIKIDEPISDFIETLTTITDEMVSNGVSIDEAAKALMEDHIKYGSFLNPVTWGGGDIYAIKQEISDPALKDGLNKAFGSRWVDVKTLYQQYRLANGQTIRSGLAKSLGRISHPNTVNFLGTKHRAVDDAYNTFIIHSILLGLMKNE
jgi:inhibitor of KinA sporulation pathway (predicted exonuclease)